MRRLGALCALLAGCSSTGSSPPAEPRDAGMDAPGVAYDPKDYCPGACATVLTCNANLDVAACEGQCAKEVTGDGHLIPEIAADYFASLRDLKSDPGCSFVGYWDKWELATKDHATYDPPVQVKADLDRCVVFRTDECITYDLATKRSLCFGRYYRYNVDLRGEVEHCWTLTCEKGTECLNYCSVREPCEASLQLKGEPWLAGWPQQ